MGRRETRSSKGKTLGWWSFSETPSACPKCGEAGVHVPKEGHELSEYWDLQTECGPEDWLVCCPGDCKEE